MKDKTISLPYGKEQIRLKIPGHIKFKVLDIKKTPPVRNFKQALNRALDKPINALPFDRNFKPGDKVTIAIPDKSRRGYSQPVLEILAARLKACGIPVSDITIIIARGTHPAHSQAELKALVGDKIYKAFKIVDHDCRDAKQLEYVGRTSRGTEASLNRAITGADKIITCGVIQFHYFAGFSGGRKLITPGCADYNTVLHNHRLALNPEPKTGKHPNATIGRLAGNPMHNDLMEIIGLLKGKGRTIFSIDMVLNSEREVSHFFCGDIRRAHEKGCALVKKTYTRKLTRRADFIIASAGGFPSDITFIQTHKTIEHVSKGLKKKGNMMVLGECSQGIGSETFLPWLKYKNLDELEKNLRRNFAINGHTALCTLIKARDFNIYMKTALANKMVRDMEINLVKDVQETLDKIFKSLPKKASVLIIPQGNDYLKKGDYNKAIELYEKSVNANPDSYKSYYNLGLAYEKLGDYKKSIEFYQKAISLKPDDADTYYGFGIAYGKSGDYKKSIESYQKALSLKPDDVDIYCWLGNVYGESGDYKKSIESYQKALSLKPDDADAYYNLGLAYAKSGDYKKAIEAFKKAIGLKPDDADTYRNLGFAYGKLGDDKNAMEAYKKAISINPDDAVAYCNLGVAYWKSGDYKKAVEAYQKAISIKPDYVEAHCNLGNAYGNFGDYEKAEEAYKKVINLKPDDVDAYYWLGLYYSLLGNRDEALRQCKILRKLDEELAKKLLNLINRER